MTPDATNLPANTTPPVLRGPVIPARVVGLRGPGEASDGCPPEDQFARRDRTLVYILAAGAAVGVLAAAAAFAAALSGPAALTGP